MKHYRITALITAFLLMLPAVSAYAASYVTLYGFSFDINSNAEAVIHGYDNRSSTPVIPDTLLSAPVTTIDSKSFYNDDHITSVSFENTSSLKTIGDNAFYGCSSLKEITLTDSIEALGFGAFENCSSAEKITLGSSLSDIPAQCFKGCTDFESLTVPDSVKSIGDYAFADCTSLDYAYIPAYVSYISDSAFTNDDLLTIYCYSDSCAHIFAEEKGIPYVLLDMTFIHGDADDSSKVNISDVSYLQRVLSHLIESDNRIDQRCDVDLDKSVKIQDASFLQRYIARLPSIEGIAVNRIEYES